MQTAIKLRHSGLVITHPDGNEMGHAGVLALLSEYHGLDATDVASGGFIDWDGHLIDELEHVWDREEASQIIGQVVGGEPDGQANERTQQAWRLWRWYVDWLRYLLFPFRVARAKWAVYVCIDIDDPRAFFTAMKRANPRPAGEATRSSPKSGPRGTSRKTDQMALDVLLPTDTRFSDSPNEGDPECLCSRCGLVIAENELAIRAWPVDGIYEYRFHPACLGLDSFEEPEEDWPDSLDPLDELTEAAALDLASRQCRICGCTEAMQCPGGCYWVEEDLCSRCVDKESGVRSQE